MPDHNQEVLGPRDSHVETALVGRVAQTRLHGLMVVAADAIKDNDIFLSTLEGINRVYLNRTTSMDLSQPFFYLPPQQQNLRLIRCNYTNLTTQRSQATIRPDITR